MRFIAGRMDSANSVLSRFTSLSLLRKPGGIYVAWGNRDGRYVRRWACRGQDFYPVWTRIFPHGGTCSTAVSQLVRWIQDKPVLPLSTWRYWASDTCKLLRPSVVDDLGAAGYPSEAICVLCKQRIDGGLDWWSLKDVSGPCCSWRSGCRQQVQTND
jgi:hypothetical protein